jgi:hypothetical protein
MQTTQKGTRGSKAKLEEVIELHYGQLFICLTETCEFLTLLNIVW